MKGIYSIIVIVILCCCSNQNNKELSLLNQYDSISTSIGMKKLVEISFPKIWYNKPVNDQIENFNLENTSKENSNQLFYFVNKYYNDLYNELNPIRNESLPSVPEFKFGYTSGFHKIDSTVNPVRSYSLSDSLLVVLYKDGGRYNSLDYNEKHSIVRYVILYTFFNHKKVDSLTIFYDEKNPIESHYRYFYVSNKEINTFDFFSNELQTQMLIEKKFVISDYGKIALSKTAINNNVASDDNALPEKWRGEYYFQQELLDGYGRNSKIVVKINIIKGDSSILEHFLANENGDIYKINNSHFKLLGEIVTGKKENSDSLKFYSKKILIGDSLNLQLPVFTMYEYGNLYSIKSLLTNPPHNTLEEMEIKKK